LLHIREYEGDRADLLLLFRMADESESQILSYYRLGAVLVALDDDKVVGMAQVEKDAGKVEGVLCPFIGGGHFAYHYSRGKLSSDSIFREILKRGSY